MRALPALLAATALVAGACSGDDGAATQATSTTVGETGATGEVVGGGGTFVRGLRPFDSCDAFLAHVRAEAMERVGPYGLDGFGGGWPRWEEVAATDDMATEEAADTAGAAPSEAGSEGDGGFTGTNVQEAGVDEPDIVKTDGDRIITISGQVLTYVDVSGGEPVVTDRLRLDEGWDHQLFFQGDRALVFTNGGEWFRPMPVDAAVDVAADAEAGFAADDIGPSEWGPSALIMEIDLSDPGDLRITASMRIEGQYLSARAIGDHVRVALSSSPSELPWLYPGSPAGEDRATEANREVIAESTIDDWVPNFRLTDAAGDTTGQLVDCDRLHRPADFGGFEVISVIDLDLATGLGGAADAVGVLAGGQTIYSSTDRFYVATTRWIPPDTGDASVDDDRFAVWTEDYRTEVHAFAIAPGEPTTYVASGSVDGSLLNQFSLGEYEGDLRVVHTEGSPWNRDDLSETFLTVLREEGDELVEIGKVGGLGKGEQLYAARLLGDVGFAVTFRQIDPFYVLDLSDPNAPTVAGELKIPGFSTYLHPIGEDRVLGIGKDATEDGRVTGLKLSLFDVSVPAQPRELAVWTMPDAESPAEYDHRAFQMWGSTAILPVQSWNTGRSEVILFDVADAITEIGRVSHDDDGPPSSDCRTVTPELLTPESSELWWMSQEGHVQVCGPDDVGGWSGSSCERIPVEDLQWWYWDDAVREADVAALGLSDDDVIEICWPDGWQEAIQRSLVIDGVLYTMSRSALQANDLDGLGVLGQVPIT